MERNQRWQDWVILVVGVWLFFAPFFIAYASANDAAAWNSYVIGALAAIFAASALWSPASKSEEWVNLVLGLWAIVAPFVFAFYATEPVAAWNMVVAGVLIAGDGIWALTARPSGGARVQH